MPTLLDLATKLENRAAALRHEASAASVAVATALLVRLVNETPVDTSRALSNWQVRIGIGAGGPIDPYFYGTRGSTSAESSANAIAVGKLVLKNKKPGDDIVLSNTLPYIRRLNDGYSGQAPAGFVDQSIVLARKIVKTL